FYLSRGYIIDIHSYTIQKTPADPMNPGFVYLKFIPTSRSQQGIGHRYFLLHFILKAFCINNIKRNYLFINSVIINNGCENQGSIDNGACSACSYSIFYFSRNQGNIHP